MSDCEPSCTVAALAWQLGSLVQDLAEVHHVRECIGEIRHEHGTNQANNVVRIGNSRRREQGDDPVAGSEALPDNFAILFNDRKKFEDTQVSYASKQTTKHNRPQYTTIDHNW